PSWIVVNADGTITASPDATVVSGSYPVQVTVTYPDGTTDVIESVITVGTTDALDNQPNYQDVTVEPGSTVTVAAPLNSDGTTPPAGTTYAPADASTLPSWIVVNADGTITASPDATVVSGSYPVQVTVTYPDGTTEVIDVVISIIDTTAPPAPIVNPVTSEDTVVSGIGVPGNTITVTFPDGTTGTAVVQPDGTWSVAIPSGVDLVGGEVLPVTSTDASGNVSPEATVTVTDTTAPLAPPVNPVTSEDTVVTGTGTPGNTITVKFPDGTTGTAVVQPDGTWSVAIPSGVDLVGGEVLPVTETDASGNVSPATSVTVTDTTGPAAPTVRPVTSEDTVVTGIGVPGNTITVTFPDGTTGTAVVQPDGTWSVAIPSGVDLVGGEVLPVTSTDASGNVSPEATVTVTDTTAPLAPPVNPVTSEDTAVIGTGTPGNTITVKFPDGTTGTAVVQPDGTWSVAIPSGVDLVGGEVLPVTETDASGNVSPATSVTVTDTTGPAAPTVNPVTSEDTVVTGIGVPGNTITVTFPEGTTGTAVVQPDGTWSVAIPSGVDLVGGEVLPVTSTDPSGNVSPEATVTVSDISNPLAPIVNPVTSEDTAVTGTGTPGNTITVKFPDGTTGTAVVQPDGTWSVAVPAGVDLVGGEVLPVIETDASGNVSPATSVTVTDITAPIAPPINTVSSTATNVTGVGIPGNTVTVTFPDGTIGTSVVQADGTWSVAIPSGTDLVVGDVLTATQTDGAGNVSPSSSTTVSDDAPPLAPIVNDVTSEDTVVTGTGTPGNTITVTFPDGTTGTSVVQADGTWTVVIPDGVNLVGGEVLPVTETDSIGNSGSTSVTVIVIDKTAPAAPTVNPVTSEDTVVTGIGVPGNTIAVTFPDGTQGTAVVQPDGTWSVAIPSGVDLVGGEVLPVTSTDPAGNVSPEASVTVTDTTAPLAPVVNPVTSEDTVVTGTGTPGNTITVKFPDGTTGTALVQPDGTWSVPVPPGVDLVGGEVLPVIETDASGNVSPATSVTVTDTTAPAAPTVNPVTSEDTVVTGIGVPGNTITVTFPDGTQGTAVVQPDGTWSVPVPPGVDLVGGEVLPVTSTDPAGNVSPEASVTVTDTTAPLAPVVNPVTSEDTVVTGTGTPGNTITVKFPDGTTGTAVVQADGTWSVPVPPGVDLVGGEVLPVIETDASGNVSPATSVTVTDTTAPAAPTVNPVTSEDTVVTGIGVPGNTITVTFPDGTTGTAVVQPDGTWSVAIPADVDLVGGEVLPVTSTDASGNVSPEASVTVTDTTAPLAPVVNPVTSEDIVVTGTGTPGNTITVKFSDGTTGTAVVQPDGTWSIPVPPGVDLVGGEVLPVIETDASGNVSPATSVTVTDTTAPLAPVVNPITSEDTSVTGFGIPGNTITVTFPDGTQGTVVVQPDGTWSVEIPSGVDLIGGEVLPVIETDGSGNVSPEATVTVMDETAPELEVNPINSGDTTVTGTSEPGSTVSVILPDGTKVTTVTKPDGTWTVTVPPLKAGDKVTAVSTDEAGNTSEPETEIVSSTPIEDTTAPEIDVNPVKPDDTVVGGTSEPGTTITVTLPDGTKVTTVTKPDGTWTVTVPPLKAGDKVTAVSTDEAGNTSEPETEIVSSTPIEDTTAPEIDVNPVKPGDTVVGGTSEPGTTITVTLPDGTKVTTVTKPDGTWTVTVPPLKARDKVTAVSTDKAGNTSEAKVVIVPSENVLPSETVDDSKIERPSAGSNSVIDKGNKINAETTKNNELGKTTLPDTGEKDNSGLAAGALLLGGLTLLAGRKRKQEDIESEEK
ncbi:Ig-like domain-containing protein, partial [Macrococcoides caseolyticum]|uniref:Ig-like domain-containing protein n=1 Tax=Macrococcoides caseolyticum TaxID=69966 RepID=UPI001F44F6BF